MKKFLIAWKRYFGSFDCIGDIDGDFWRNTGVLQICAEKLPSLDRKVMRCLFV